MSSCFPGKVTSDLTDYRPIQALKLDFRPDEWISLYTDSFALINARRKSFPFNWFAADHLDM